MVAKGIHLERRNSLLIIQKMRMLMKQKRGKISKKKEWKKKEREKRGREKREKDEEEVETTGEEMKVVRS